MSLSRLEQAIQAGVLPPEYVRASLGKIGASAAEHLLASDVLPGGGNGFEVIDNAETKAAFERAFDLTAGIYASPDTAWADLTPPTSEDFAITHPDLFSRLAAVHEHMEAGDKQPEILITAHLGKQQTIAFFDAKTAVRYVNGIIINDKGIPGNPLKQQSDGNGLWVNPNITDDIWRQCDTPPADSTHTATITTPDGMTWSISITSGAAAPDNLRSTGISHTQLTAQGTPLLTISQYLRLQLGHIQAHEPDKPPVDAHHWSWLHGEAGGFAPCGDWDPFSGRVFVGWIGVGYRNGNLGSRSPVREVIL